MIYFSHKYELTESTYVFKELGLDSTFAKMEQCEVVDYENYMVNYHIGNNKE